MYRIFSYPKTYHKCNTVYLRLMRRQCEAIKNIVKCLKSMRRQCEAIKNTVKCLLDPINILNSSSRDSCFTCDSSSTIQIVPLFFNIGMVILFTLFTFFKPLIALKLKSLWVWLEFSLIHNSFLWRYAKNWIFHQNSVLQYFFFLSQLFNYAMCKIRLIGVFPLYLKTSLSLVL